MSKILRPALAFALASAATLAAPAAAQVGGIAVANPEQAIANSRAWQAARKFTPSNTFAERHWTALLAAGSRTTLKRGSVGESVHRLQRAGAPG